jgi:hypothetical protein
MGGHRRKTPKKGLSLFYGRERILVDFWRETIEENGALQMWAVGCRV